MNTHGMYAHLLAPASEVEMNGSSQYHDGQVIAEKYKGNVSFGSALLSEEFEQILTGEEPETTQSPTTEPTAVPEPTVEPEPSIEPEPSVEPEPSQAPDEVPPYNDPYVLDNSYAYIFGRNDYQMMPDDYMARGEAAAVLYRLLKQNGITDENGFIYNVNNPPVFENMLGAWDRSAMEYMAYLGLYSGSTVNNYAPVTRGEAFKMMCVALGFTADTSLSDMQYALILRDAGFIQGDESGNLHVEDYITRAEFCTIYNIIIGREYALLEMADGTPVTAATYGFTDIEEGAWYTEIILRATSAYNENGYVDLELRAVRNVVDDYA